MKRNLKGALVLLAGIAIFYTACKKTDGSLTQTVNVKDVVSKMTLNLSQSLNDNYGVFSVKLGLQAPAKFEVAQSHKLFGANPVCGFTVDTALDYSYNLADGSPAHVVGNAMFTLNCTAGAYSGFHVIDTITITGATTLLSSFLYKVGENFVLQSTGPSNPAAQLVLDGPLNQFGGFQAKAGGKPYSRTDHIVITGLHIDPTTGDLVSGSATFTTMGNDGFTDFNLKGTIAFIGNHLIKITIDGKVYTVNLLTGQVS